MYFWPIAGRETGCRVVAGLDTPSTLYPELLDVAALHGVVELDAVSGADSRARLERGWAFCDCCRSHGALQMLAGPPEFILITWLVVGVSGLDIVPWDNCRSGLR